MKAILQRVKRGQVSIDNRVVGQIEGGYVVLLGVTHGDGSEEVRKLAGKIVNLRVFEDETGKMNRSLLEVGGAILVISQFTLYADAKKGRRPSFSQAAPPDLAEPLVAEFAEVVRQLGVQQVETGVFGAHMLVGIENDGPVAIILDTDLL